MDRSLGVDKDIDDVLAGTVFTKMDIAVCIIDHLLILNHGSREAKGTVLMIHLYV